MAHESFYKSVLLFALVVLLHAAYSTTEWRHFFHHKSSSSSGSGNPDQSQLAAFLAQFGSMGNVPIDIVIQTLIGLALAMLAVLNIGGEFKEIRSTIELCEKSWEHGRNRPSFYIYNHRGKAFSRNYVPPPSQQSSHQGKRNLQAIPDEFLS